MDAHVCHFADGTLAAAYSQGIWPCIIPASMTAVLQPLDVYVFSRFKAFFRVKLHQHMMQGPNEDISTSAVLDALMHTMKAVLQRHSWSAVFDDCGFGSVFSPRAHLLDTLEWNQKPDIASDLPTLQEFQACFPRGKHINFQLLLAGLVRPVRRGARQHVVPEETSLAPEAPVQSWKDRLRPRHEGRVVGGADPARVRHAINNHAPEQTQGDHCPPAECSGLTARGTLTRVGVSLKRSRSNF